MLQDLRAKSHQGAAGKTFAGFTLRNDLEPPAFSKYPWLPTAKAWFQKQPEVLDALMSGSGSSVFALTHIVEAVTSLRERFLAEFGATLLRRAVLRGNYRL